MRAVIQRVSSSSVSINDSCVGEISEGLLILLGIEHEDANEDADWLIQKIVQMRIFEDGDGKMNLSVKDVDGGILVVSQFTLHASTKKGNRPSFIAAAAPEQARELYDSFLKKLESVYGKNIPSGEFGANMQVALVNDGPVTILIDSKIRW